MSDFWKMAKNDKWLPLDCFCANDIVWPLHLSARSILVIFWPFQSFFFQAKPACKTHALQLSAHSECPAFSECLDSYTPQHSMRKLHWHKYVPTVSPQGHTDSGQRTIILLCVYIRETNQQGSVLRHFSNKIKSKRMNQRLFKRKITLHE